MTSIVGSSFLFTLWVVLCISWILVTTFWLLTMQRALELISYTSKMKPQNVWLAFIPLFGLYWQFEVVNAVADGFGEEYVRRGIIPREARPGRSVGITANILLCCGAVPSFGILVSIFSMIPRLIHLAKIKNYTSELEKIIQTQMQYSSQISPMPFVCQSETNPTIEENLQKNNPNRFMPPQTTEEIENRWKKK